MVTITKAEHDKQWNRAKEIFKRNAINEAYVEEFGGTATTHTKEVFYYMWVLSKWEQDEFENIQYNNWITAETLQKIYKRLNQLG